MTIQEMDLIIKHRSGKSNTNADALSRNPVHLNPTDTNVNSCKAVTVVELSSEGGLLRHIKAWRARYVCIAEVNGNYCNVTGVWPMADSELCLKTSG